MKEKKAVIFDMDGVISDTQKFHAEVESVLLKQYGIDLFPDEITKIYSGIADEKMFEELFEEHKVTVPSIDAIVSEKWNIMREIARGRIEPIPHVLMLIQALKKEGFKLAIASASTKEFINEVIKELDIEKYFDELVSAQEVKRGKPAPDIFLLAASRLGVSPEEAVVIEDGRSGMIGAKKANMKCIGLINKADEDYPATIVVTSLEYITPNEIHAL